MKADMMVWLKSVNHSNTNNISQINFICSYRKSWAKGRKSSNLATLPVNPRPLTTNFVYLFYFPADRLFISTTHSFFITRFNQLRNIRTTC